MRLGLITQNDEILQDLRNRELEFPGLVAYALERLAQFFKKLSREVAFSPAGSHTGALGGRSGESWSKAYFYHFSQRRGAALQVITISSRLANIFEGKGTPKFDGQYPIMRRTGLAFQMFGPEAKLQEIVTEWAETEDTSVLRTKVRKGGAL